VLFEGLEKNVFVDTATAEDRTTHEEVRIRLAGLLPSLARWSSSALNGHPNELVDACRFFYFLIVY
jgi:peroxin-3